MKHVAATLSLACAGLALACGASESGSGGGPAAGTAGTATAGAAGAATAGAAGTATAGVGGGAGMAALGGADGGTVEGYPPGPYGAAVGDTIANVETIGFVSHQPGALAYAQELRAVTLETLRAEATHSHVVIHISGFT